MDISDKVEVATIAINAVIIDQIAIPIKFDNVSCAIDSIEIFTFRVFVLLTKPIAFLTFLFHHCCGCAELTSSITVQNSS